MSDLNQLIDSTIKIFEPYGESMPSLEKKYFSRPPIKFLAKTVNTLCKKTGFAKGVFTDDELEGNLPESKDKLNFFKVLKEYTEICLNETIDVDIKSIASGKEVEKTLLFMQAFARAAQHPVVTFEEARTRLLSTTATDQNHTKTSSQRNSQSSQPIQVQSVNVIKTPMQDLNQLIDSTIKIFEPYGESMPSLEKKYFSRPPIKFLAKTVNTLCKKTGFAKGVFTDDELEGNLSESKDKLNFFKVLKEYTEICLNETIDVDIKSIASGKEVEKTLLFMQAFARAAQHPVVTFEEARTRLLSTTAPDQNHVKTSSQRNSQSSHPIQDKSQQPQIQVFDLDDYHVKSIIGEGSTSCVKLVTKSGGNQKYALKELKTIDHLSLKRFLSEGEILYQLHHPNIIQIYGVNYGDESHPPSILLSYAPHSLETLISGGKLTQNEKNRIVTEIVQGMKYIHSQQLMHRDLKPGNILLDEEKHVLITDFGLAKEENLDESQSKGVGTLRYMAPELFDDDSQYDSSVDVYSFGIMLNYIITEKHLKFSMNNLYQRISPTLPDTHVDWVRKLILRCLSFTPTERPTFSEISSVLNSHHNNLFAP